MRMIAVDGTYGVMASDNTDWTCTFSGGIITVADEAGCIHAEFLADDIPSVDAVPVVRCRECKKSGLTEFGKRYCSEPMGAFYGCIPVEDDFFCSGGRRKDDNHAQD